MSDYQMPKTEQPFNDGKTLEDLLREMFAEARGKKKEVEADDLKF